MSIDKDLLLAILSMDSYNRGYDEGIKGLGGLESPIGEAKLKDQSNTLSSRDSVLKGF